jgi:hypothetical protein
MGKQLAYHFSSPGFRLLTSFIIFAVVDALPSLGVNPLEGSPKCSCEKLGLERRSWLLTLERGRGSSWEPRD